MSLTKHRNHAAIEKYASDADYDRFMAEFAEQNDIAQEDLWPEDDE